MSMLNLFRSSSTAVTPSIQCPFCLHACPASRGLKKCLNPSCGRELPLQYIERYREIPPLFLPMMGLPDAGKTAFLFAATIAVVGATEFWQDFLFYPCTDETDAFIIAARRAIAEGRLPDTTPELEYQKAYVLQMLNLPRWGNRTWVIRDVPGEHFNRRVIPPEQVPFVVNATTAFLFFDFNQGNANAGNAPAAPEERTIDYVLRSYVFGLQEHGVNFRRNTGRKIVVVLTKANQLNLPPHLMKYLVEDEHWDRELRARLTNGSRYFDDKAMAVYMERLSRVSAELSDWVRQQPGGELLHSTARDNHLDLHFCMITSIPCGVERVGQDFVPRGKWQNPFRILDPLYWALELNSVPA